MQFGEVLGNKLIIADGGLGTFLQGVGLAPGKAPALWNMTHPGEVIEAHAAFIRAGATLLATNTFTANTLALTHEPYETAEVITAGVAHARKAREQEESGCFIALDIGPLGHLLEPLGEVGFKEAVELFSEQMLAGRAAGVDLVLIETMIDLRELEAALTAADKISDLPLIASVSLGSSGRMLDGSRLAQVCAVVEDFDVDAVGINCGTGPDELSGYLRELQELTVKPLLLCPNAGLPTMRDGQAQYSLGPKTFAELLHPLAGTSAAIVGGCCGTTPAHIKALADACKTVRMSTENPA